MQVFRSLAEASGKLSRSAVAIGNFDGVHLGHQALFHSARSAAASFDGSSVALTFDPHPGQVLSPSLAPRLLTPLDRKLELFAAAGLQAAVVQTFDAEFAALDAERFAREYLLAGLGARAIAVGPDFSFGKGRAGTVERLRAWVAPAGVTVTVVPKVEVDGLPVSSTRIRELVLEGRVSAAARLLGRPYDIDGVVVTGMGRGRTIGWPTANVAPRNELLPAIGVYAVRAKGPFGELPGAANLGRKPTFGDGQPVTVEVHLIDWNGEGKDRSASAGAGATTNQALTGQPMRVKFLERLRPEMRFASIEALVAQIGKDVEEARRIAAGPLP
jgi:riboflavin kinase/FMN adenylyltransferase